MDCKRALAETGRRRRGGAEAPAREGHGGRRQARRARDDRGQGRSRTSTATAARSWPSAARPSPSRATRSSSRSPSTSSTRRGRGPGGGRERSRRSASSSSRRLGENIERARRGALRGRGRRGRSRPTSIRRRTRSACSSRANGHARARAARRHAHPFANPRYLSRDEVPADEVRAEREIYEKLPDVAGEARGDPCEDRRRDAPEAVLRRVGARRPGLDPRRPRRSARRSPSTGAEVLEFVRYARRPE